MLVFVPVEMMLEAREREDQRSGVVCGSSIVFRQGRVGGASTAIRCTDGLI